MASAVAFNAPVLASLASASLSRASENRALPTDLGPEEEQAANTLQRMITPDYAADSGLKLLSQSVPSALGGALSGGGELRRMSSVYTAIDDSSLALSRTNSMETWTLYPPPGAVDPLAPPIPRIPIKRERESEMENHRKPLFNKRKTLPGAPLGLPPHSGIGGVYEEAGTLMCRINSSQQELLDRMSSLERTFAEVGDLDPLTLLETSGIASPRAPLTSTSTTISLPTSKPSTTVTGETSPFISSINTLKPSMERPELSTIQVISTPAGFSGIDE
jgi:hypothetical protein